MDLFKETYRWTLGACVEWNLEMKQFSDMTSQSFREFVERTHIVVHRYINGQQGLNHSCSDLECHLALAAREMFKPHL